MLIKDMRPHYAAGEAGGTGTEENDDETTSGKVKSSDVLSRYGGQTSEAALRMAERLADAENANYKLREQKRQLTAERDALKKTAAPEGSAVLTKDDAAAWAAYQALGKVDDLTKAVADRDAAQAELTTLRRDAQLRAAAEAHGYKATVLGKLPSLVGKDLIVKDVTEGDATVRRAFVKDGTTETALPEYIAAHDPELAPALAIEGNVQQRSAGATYPAQQGNASQRTPQNAAKAHMTATKYAVPGRDK